MNDVNFLTCPLCVRCQAPGVRVCVGKSAEYIGFLLLSTSLFLTMYNGQKKKKKICLYFCFVSIYWFEFVAIIIQYSFLQFICYGRCLRTSESVFPLKKIWLELYKLLLLLLLVLLLLLLVLLLLLL